ncbi:hypothetical protein GCM10027569_40560 [Flindersiella endophytica]
MMNLGVPPTARKARTGEFTPPGVTTLARPNQDSEAGTVVTRPLWHPDLGALPAWQGRAEGA